VPAHSTYDDKTPLTREILTLLSQVAGKLGPDNNGIKQWMAQNIHNPAIIDLLGDTTLTMMRVLNAIGQLGLANGITISEQFGIPKGTVSKITRRLAGQQLITQESLPNNRKEILFRLTPLGQELCDANRAFDAEMEKGFVEFLRRYDADQLRFMVRVLQDIREASFLNNVASLEDMNLTE
jgi:DNA-binding MarR family transcriptional regulator